MPQKETDLIPRMVAYLRAHLHDSAPTTEEPPIWQEPVASGDERQLRGSANIRWLARACLLCFTPQSAVRDCIAEYQRELAVGHRGFEEMTVSHDGQWLGAHYAIRMWLLTTRPDSRGLDSHQLDLLHLANSAWCGAELALMREFYLPAIGVLCPAARFEGVLVSPQRSVLAAWDALPRGGPRPSIGKPAKGRQFNDTFCLELASDLIEAGDDLGRSVAKIPKLAFPLFVEKGPSSLRAYWNPGKEVLSPIYAVAWPSGEGEVDARFLTYQRNGLPKGKPAMGSTTNYAFSEGDFKQIG